MIKCMKTLAGRLPLANLAGLLGWFTRDRRKRGLEEVGDTSQCCGQWHSLISPFLCIPLTDYIAVYLPLRSLFRSILSR